MSAYHRTALAQQLVQALQIKVDPKYGTAWVNDADWLSLPDSLQGVGIAGILGGVDNDVCFVGASVYGQGWGAEGAGLA